MLTENNRHDGRSMVLQETAVSKPGRMFVRTLAYFRINDSPVGGMGGLDWILC